MYKIGDEVSYGLHGKCVIIGIETKELDSGPVGFYQVRAIRNPITAKAPLSKSDPHILIPIDTAKTKGLRPLMTKAEAETSLKMISDPDYHFELNDTWVAKQKLLEGIIRKEGSIGLAKVVGHLYVLIKQDAVPRADVVRFYEHVHRIFTRELSEAMNLNTKEVETLINRSLKQKLATYS